MVAHLGILIRSVCGILGPKLSKALKIRKPVAVITNKETALAQCAIRTTQECSYAAEVILVFPATCTVFSPGADTFAGMFSESPMPRVTLIFPVAAMSMLQHIRHA